MKIVVFDFDKTLTYIDSMNQFCLWRMKSWRFFFFPIYCILLTLVKVHILSLKREKEICIRILFPTNYSEFLVVCQRFSSRIKLNNVMDILKEEVRSGSRVIVLSASPIYYLDCILPSVELIGTTMSLNEKNEIVGINQHPYGLEKVKALFSYGIEYIDEMYYDSISDEVLLPLCAKAYKIVKGEIFLK